MFKPEKIVKVEVLGLQKNKEDFISLIHKFGLFHINDLSNSVKEDKIFHNANQDAPLKETEKISELTLRANFIREVFEKHIDEKNKKEIFPGRIPKNLTLNKISEMVEKKLSTFEKETIKVDQSLKNINNRIEEIKSDIELIDSYKIKFNINQFENSKYTNLIFGRMLKEDLELCEFSDVVKANSIILTNGAGKKIGDVMILYKRSIEEELNQALKQINFEREKVTLSTTDVNINTVSALKDELTVLIKKKNEKSAELNNLYSKYAEEGFIHEILSFAKSRAEVSTNFARTEKTFFMGAYMPENNFDSLNKLLLKHDIVLSKASQLKTAPVILNNLPYIKSFEQLTKMFGTPKYNTIDPTFFMALFFPFFFGFMFSDMGYGIMVMIFSSVFLILGKKSKTLFDYGIIFASAGIWTIVFGLLFGSFFGNLIKITPLLFDPFQKSIVILIAAIIIGFIHLNIGIILSMVNNLTNNNKKDFLFNDISLVLLQGSIIALIFKQNLLGGLLFALTLIMLFIKSSLFGLMEITSFVGMVLSYARILALSLATGGIALAINIVSAKIMGAGWIGLILAPIIIIFGHIFNFVINMIGSTINAVRLHFVEFFTVFFQEGGEEFKPFKIEKD